MSVAAPNDAYNKMLVYAEHKAYLEFHTLVVQGFMAGIWVALYGHCCTVMSSFFFDPNVVVFQGLAKFVYGLLFPGAFVAVTYTGTELFTGNTVTMLLYLLEAKSRPHFIRNLLHLLRVWTCSLFMNLVGAIFGAVVVSFASGQFQKGTPAIYLYYMAAHKTHYTFLQAIALGIGCNMMVCLATWCVVCTADGAGKILAMWFTIAVFAMGGFEHIVANFYTLTIGFLAHQNNTLNIKNIILNNWIPVCIGNVLGGTIFTGVIWWYALRVHHKKKVVNNFVDLEKSPLIEKRVSLMGEEC